MSVCAVCGFADCVFPSGFTFWQLCDFLFWSLGISFMGKLSVSLSLLGLQAKLLPVIFSFFFCHIVPVGPSSPNRCSCIHGKKLSPCGLDGSIEPIHTFKEYLQTENAQIKHLLSTKTSHSTHTPPVVQTKLKASGLFGSVHESSCDLKSELIQIKNTKSYCYTWHWQRCWKSQLGVSPRDESKTDFAQEPLQPSNILVGGKFLLMLPQCVHMMPRLSYTFTFTLLLNLVNTSLCNHIPNHLGWLPWSSTEVHQLSVGFVF